MSSDGAAWERKQFTPKTLARCAHQGRRLASKSSLNSESALISNCQREFSCAACAKPVACRCKARSRSVEPTVLRGSGYLAAWQPFLRTLPVAAGAASQTNLRCQPYPLRIHGMIVYLPIDFPSKSYHSRKIHAIFSHGC